MADGDDGVGGGGAIGVSLRQWGQLGCGVAVVDDGDAEQLHGLTNVEMCESHLLILWLEKKLLFS